MTATEAYSTPYLDTSVYIAAIKGPTTEDPNRVQVSAQVLTEAESGRLRIIASTFIHAEVIRDRGEQAPLDPAKETIIDGFFQRSFISWVELDVTGGRLARRLSRRFAIKPPDAVHIAAAIRGKADVFFTWDDRLIGAVSGDVDGLAVCQPYVYQAAQPQLDLFAAPVEMGGTDGKEEPPAELAEGDAAESPGSPPAELAEGDAAESPGSPPAELAEGDAAESPGGAPAELAEGE